MIGKPDLLRWIDGRLPAAAPRDGDGTGARQSQRSRRGPIPAAARGPDGALYLFPRLVAKGDYSRIGIARVRFNDAGDPIGVERVGIAGRPRSDDLTSAPIHSLP